jgi:hypothetical protein
MVEVDVKKSQTSNIWKRTEYFITSKIEVKVVLSND